MYFLSRCRPATLFSIYAIMEYKRVIGFRVLPDDEMEEWVLGHLNTMKLPLIS